MTTTVDNIISTLDDAKALNIKSIDVRNITTLTDTIVVCSGRSSRHVKAVANRLCMYIKSFTKQSPRAQGLTLGQWVLVDNFDAVIHIMLPEIREFYQLEKLWSHDLINKSI